MSFILTEEQEELLALVRKFSEKEILPYAHQMDVEAHFVPGLIQKIADLGFMGINVPEEYGGVGADADIAGHAQLAAAAQGEAVDRGDGGDGQRLQLAEHVVALLAEGLAFRLGQGAHLADVGAGHECLLAAAGDDQGADLVVRLHLLHQLVDILQYLGIQGIEGLGPVDGGNGNVALLFQQNIRHACSSLYALRRPRYAALHAHIYREFSRHWGLFPVHIIRIIVYRQKFIKPRKKCFSLFRIIHKELFRSLVISQTCPLEVSTFPILRAKAEVSVYKRRGTVV